MNVSAMNMNHMNMNMNMTAMNMHMAINPAFSMSQLRDMCIDALGHRPDTNPNPIGMIQPQPGLGINIAHSLMPLDVSERAMTENAPCLPLSTGGTIIAAGHGSPLVIAADPSSTTAWPTQGPEGGVGNSMGFGQFSGVAVNVSGVGGVLVPKVTNVAVAPHWPACLTPGVNMNVDRQPTTQTFGAWRPIQAADLMNSGFIAASQTNGGPSSPIHGVPPGGASHSFAHQQVGKDGNANGVSAMNGVCVSGMNINGPAGPLGLNAQSANSVPMGFSADMSVPAAPPSGGNVNVSNVSMSVPMHVPMSLSLEPSLGAVLPGSLPLALLPNDGSMTRVFCSGKAIPHATNEEFLAHISPVSTYVTEIFRPRGGRKEFLYLELSNQSAADVLLSWHPMKFRGTRLNFSRAKPTTHGTAGLIATGTGNAGMARAVPMTATAVLA